MLLKVKRKILFASALYACLLLFSTASFASGSDSQAGSLCAKFDGLFPDDGLYSTVSAITGEDKRINLSVGTFYTDRKEEKLYGSLLLQRGEDRYKGIVQFYPDIDLLFLSPIESSSKADPTEITDFLASMKRLPKEKWGDKAFPNYEAYTPCDSLSYFIQGTYFSDGKLRQFIRHFPFGHRQSTGKLMCSNWGGVSDQILFYQSFVPAHFKIKDQDIYVDDDHVGIKKNDEFQYLCGLKKFVSGREKIFKSEADLLVPSEALVGLQIPNSTGNDVTDSNAQAYDKKWENKILENIIKGRQLFRK